MFGTAAAVSALYGIGLLCLDVGRWLKYETWQPYRLEDVLAGSDFLSWVRDPHDWIGVARIAKNIASIPVSFWLVIPLPALLTLVAMGFRLEAKERRERVESR